MFYKVFLLLFSIIFVSISCHAMEEECSSYASYPPTFEKGMAEAIDSLHDYLPSLPDRDNFVKRRLNHFWLTFNRDDEMREISFDTLCERTPFPLILPKLLTMDSDLFTRVENSLAYQEQLVPLTKVMDFNLFLEMNRSCMPLMEKLPFFHRLFLVLLNAPSIDDLAKIVVDAKHHTALNQNIGFLCDVEGAMLKKQLTTSGLTLTRRKGIKPLIKLLSNQPNVHLLATSAGSDRSVALQSLRDFGLSQYFELEKRNKYKKVSSNQVLGTSDEAQSLKNKLEVRRHGRVAVARKKEKKQGSPNFPAKGFAFSAAFPEEDFSTVIVADDNVFQFKVTLESLLLSRAYPSLEYIYFVLTKSPSSPKVDKLKPSTRRLLTDAFADNSI